MKEEGKGDAQYRGIRIKNDVAGIPMRVAHEAVLPAHVVVQAVCSTRREDGELVRIARRGRRGVAFGVRRLIGYECLLVFIVSKRGNKVS